MHYFLLQLVSLIVSLIKVIKAVGFLTVFFCFISSINGFIALSQYFAVTTYTASSFHLYWTYGFRQVIRYWTVIVLIIV